MSEVVDVASRFAERRAHTRAVERFNQETERRAAARKGEWQTTFDMEVQPNGRWEATSLTFENWKARTPLSSTFLRDVPLGRLVAAAATRLNRTAVTPNVPDVPVEVRAEWPDGDQRRVFEWVDRVYTAALMLGLPPTKTVAESFGVAHSKAAYLVRRARAHRTLSVRSANDPTKGAHGDAHH